MSQKFILFVTLFGSSGYWYDAGGERVIKASGDDEGIYVNDVFSGARTETNNFTAYINPYLVVSKGGQYTKHIYIGSQRIVSKLGDLESYGQDPRRIEYAGAGVDGAKVDYAAKYKQSQQTIKDNYAYFEVDYNGTDNDDYVNGGGFCCDDAPTTRSFDPSKNDNPELFQYYYHADHLGSSSLITNLDGEVVQHIEYVPFGEVFIEERNNKWNTPYLFNAKELDEETGLYYYGARYYDSRSSVWLSTDPLQEKYPNKTPYHYCSQNPVNLVDPDGRDDFFTSQGGFVRRTAKGANVYVDIAGTDILFSNVDLSSLDNQKAVSNIVEWYAKTGAGVSFNMNGRYPVGDDPKGTVGIALEPKDKDGNPLDAIAFASGLDINVAVEGGKVSILLDNANNFVSTMIHEDVHKRRGHGFDTNTASLIESEFQAYSAQASHSSYSKTTKEFQRTVVGGLAKYLNKTSNSTARGALERVEEFNGLLPKDAHYRLQFVDQGNLGFSVNVIDNKKQ